MIREHLKRSKKDKRVKIGFQGIAGAYSEMAAEKVDKKAELFGFKTFEEIFEKVESGKLDFGVVPVENSLAGSIHKNFDLLAKHDLKIVGEEIVHVNHQLLALHGTKKEEVKEVYSHGQALAQCAINLEEHFPNAKIIEYFDTAGAAEMIKKEGDKSKACIASEKAGKVYGLNAIKKSFQDDPNNFTRFVVIAKEFSKIKDSKKQNFKTSIVFAGADVTGFLFKSLACFSLRDINLTKIESRPIPKSPWHYYFYIDIDGKYDDSNVKNAIENLSQLCKYVKILGSYDRI